MTVFAWRAGEEIFLPVHHGKVVVVDVSDRGMGHWDVSAQTSLSLSLMHEILNAARACDIKGFIKATVPV